MGDAQLFEHRTTPSHAAVGHTTRAFSVSQGSLFAQSRGAALSSEVRRRASPPSSTPPRRRPSHSTSLATISGNARSPAEPPSIVVHGARKNATLADEKGTRRSDPPTPIKVPPTYGQLDGKAQPPGHGASGNTPVTSATMANTAGKMSQPLAPRPPLISQQSNSVPSTPHQHAREFISRSRSPSPHAPLAGSHSPRSVKSEANGYMAALPRGRPTCKYETAAAFGKRRILYDIGDAPLEKLTDAPKATLNPDEEDKLSGDMRELYDRLLPTHESEQRRVKLVDKLDSILRKEWPGSDFTVNIFGSSGNMLCTTESDVDICVQTPMKKLETMHILAEAMANNGMERVICIASAKVPIVKIWDPDLKLACDINVNNTLALENTRMIKTYVQIDDRVRPLAMIIKHWAKQRVLNDAGLGGTLSSYTWICLILNFLQTRDPPILPALHQISHQAYIASDGSESGFSDNLDEVRDFGKANTETTAQLLFHFFRRYGHEVEYEKDVISVRHGKLLSRGEKGWDHAKEAQWRLCVEEPFNTTRNLGNTADPTAFRGIHLEIRQAFNYLADGAQLGKCCEQFEFPPEEKNIFKKPTPTHKPAVLTAPPNTRGGRGVSATIRAPNSRNSPNFRSPQGNRRSSSGASFANYRPPFGYSPPVNYPGLETPEQLQQQYMFNANRLMALKAQLDASQQAHYYAQAHAEAHAQARLGLVPATAPPHRPHFITGPTATQVLDDGRIHPAHYAAYGYPQRSPYDMSQPMSLSTSQEGSRTHPASPSMASAVPALRRSSQRSMGPSGVQSSSVRSQSQPARAIPGHMLVAPGAYPPPPMPAYDPNTYNTAAQPNGADLGAMVSDLPLRTGRTMSVIDPAPGSGPSREYVGYYLDETPQVQQQPPTNRLRESFQLPPIPSYGEMKRQRAGHDLMQVPVSIQTRRASRSPSPLGHMRSYSTASGLRSAPLPSMQLAQTPRQRIESTQASYEAGPLVVNGSYSSSAPTWDSQSTADDTQTDITDLTNESFASTMTAPPHVQSAYDVFGIQPLETAPEASSSVSDPLVATATRVNGALQEAQQSKPKPNGVVVVSSQPRQPTESFPPLPHSSSPEVPLPPERRGSSTSPPAATPGSAKSPWHNSTSSRSPVPPLDLSKVSSSEVAKAPLASVAPVLSPVMETRTPSPTASRSGRNTATPKAVKANGSIVIANGTYADVGRIESAKEIVTNTSNGPLASRTNRNSVPALKQDAAAEKPTASASQPPAPQPTAGQQQQQQQQQQQPGQWQTTGTKKKKRVRAKSNAQKGGPVPGEGEVMPANEAERKGG